MHIYQSNNRYAEQKVRRRKISEVLAIVAMALVLIYIADAAVGTRLLAYECSITWNDIWRIINNFVLHFFWGWN
jgi:hypothetical protein